jgi:hypothetical protein
MPGSGMPDDPEPAKRAPYKVFGIISTAIRVDANPQELTNDRLLRQ